MGTFIDLTGRVFGRWTVLSHAGRVAKDEAVNGKSVGQSLWLCRCECGVEREVLYGSLTRGGSQSCGCLRAELNWTNATHGLSRSMEQTIYQSMKTRCCNANHASFRRYGARGIKVCERWLSGSDNKTGFECFLEDMGRRPGKLTLERKNNDGHYSPENCIWATRREQGGNKSNNRIFHWKGKDMILADICRLENVDTANISLGLTTLGLSIEASVARAQKNGAVHKGDEKKPIMGMRVRSGRVWTPEDFSGGKTDAEIAKEKGVSVQAVGQQRKFHAPNTKGVGKKTGPKPKEKPELSSSPAKQPAVASAPNTTPRVPNVEYRAPVDFSSLSKILPYKKP